MTSESSWPSGSSPSTAYAQSSAPSTAHRGVAAREALQELRRLGSPIRRAKQCSSGARGKGARAIRTRNAPTRTCATAAPEHACRARRKIRRTYSRTTAPPVSSLPTDAACVSRAPARVVRRSPLRRNVARVRWDPLVEPRIRSARPFVSSVNRVAPAIPVPNSTCSGGTCVRWATRGEACGFSGRHCAYDLTCLASGDSFEGTCGVRANAGETCFDRWCATGLECVTPDGAIARRDAGKCEAPRGVGAACSDSRVCAGGLWCPGGNDVAPANVCARKPTLGEACVSECDGATYCERASGAARGICRSKKAVGSACEGGVQQCAGEFGWCETGRCVDLDPRAPGCADVRWEAAGSPALDAGAPLGPCSSVEGKGQDAGVAAPDGASATTDDRGHSSTPDSPKAAAGQSTSATTPSGGPTANATAGTDANTEASGCSLGRAPRPRNVPTAAFPIFGALVFVMRRVVRRRVKPVTELRRRRA